LGGGAQVQWKELWQWFYSLRFRFIGDVADQRNGQKKAVPF
jgi:hypothetical protein